MKTLRLLIGLCIVCLILTSAACGKKGPPLAPERPPKAAGIEHRA